MFTFASSVAFHVPAQPPAAHHRQPLPSAAPTSLTRRQLVGGSAAALLFAPTASWASPLLPDGPGPGVDADGNSLATFEADDSSFRFSLPPGWVGVTAPEQERASRGHLIAVSAATSVAQAKLLGGGAFARALVDGGSRGRDYGASVVALGPLQGVASELVSDELLTDAAAMSAIVLSTEQVAAVGRQPAYYMVRYLVNDRPAIAKLAVVQGRLYCLKVRAERDVTAGTSARFFDVDSPLRRDMELVASSYAAAPISGRCLRASNSGAAPAAPATGQACAVR